MPRPHVPMALIEQAVLDIIDRDGSCSPQALVEDPSVHDAFEWDDAVGGHLFRIEQARSYIARVHVKHTDAEGVPRVVRRYVSTPSGYIAAPVLEAAPKRDLTAEELARIERMTAELVRGALSNKRWLVEQGALNWGPVFDAVDNL